MADAGGPPPGGAAPQDERERLAVALWDEFGGYRPWNEAKQSDRVRFIGIAMRVLRAAPPDAGRDAGGAREASLMHVLESAQGAIEDAIYSEDGLDYTKGNAALTLIKEVQAALTGGRPAAEPPDVREAATQFLAVFDLWKSQPTGSGLVRWRELAQSADTLRAALGAAPPTRKRAACRIRRVVILDDYWCDTHRSYICDAAIAAYRHSIASRGAPAEPEGET